MADGFSNAVVGGDGALVREEIKSPNFVPGVSGWDLNKDGNAEFNDVTVRGKVDVVSTLGSEVVIDPTVDGIQLFPDDYDPPGTPVSHPAIIRASSVGPSPNRYGRTSIQGAYPDATDQPTFELDSSNLEGTQGPMVQFGSTGAPIRMLVNGVTPGAVTQTVFNTAGAFNYSPPSHCQFVNVEVIGSGGAGGGAPATAAGQTSAGAGGGGGAYASSLLAAAGLANTTVTVGAGGTKVAGAAGNAGNASSFGALVAAGGGGGGGICIASTTIQNAQGGGGGVATAGNVQGGGTSGGWGLRLGTTGGACMAGVGGPSAIGGGGSGGNNTDGQNGHNAGGGGGGTCNNPSAANRSGGNGADGLVIVTEYY